SAGTPVSGGPFTFSLPAGPVICSSVPVVNGSASCSTSSLPTPAAPATSDQVLAIYNPPAGSGLSGSGYILSGSGTGTNAAPPTSLTNVEISGSSSTTSF